MRGLGIGVDVIKVRGQHILRPVQEVAFGCFPDALANGANQLELLETSFEVLNFLLLRKIL